MKKRELILFFSIGLTFFLSLSMVQISFAKPTNKERKPASCTPVGELQCPKGFQASCPKQYKPSCIFLGTKQLPSCLADSADDTFYKYNLENISCEKK